MAKRHPRVIVWMDDDGIAPDGTEYFIGSEQCRGEPRMYWAQLTGAPQLDYFHPKVIPSVKEGWPTRDKAIQDAEAHYRAKVEKAGE